MTGRELGEGGQAVVSEIVHRSTGEIRALKQLRDRSDYARQRMTREVAVLTKLRHPNIIELLASGEDATWYAMPIGQPLSRHWQQTRRSTTAPDTLFERSLSIVRGILLGLAAAHDANLVHRDVKPSNILLVRGVPQIADFGIVHVPDEERLTEKPASNSFAPHIPSLYNPRVAAKLADCFGVASVWAWMLADDPRVAHGHYHWRWHSFLADARCEIARATLAVCSDDRHGPKDAERLLHFIERELGLKLSAVAAIEDENVEKIREAQAIAKARSVEERIASESLVAVIAASIRSFVEAVVAHCEALTRRLQAQGVEVYLRQAGRVPSTGSNFVAEPLEETLTGAAATPGMMRLILTISAGPDSREHPMQASVFFYWHDNGHEDGSRVSLGVAFSHRHPELRKSHYFKVSTDGLVLDQSWQKQVSPTALTDLIDRFLLSPDHYL